VSFLERLRAYLERVAQAPEGLPILKVDVARHCRTLLLAHGNPGRPDILRRMLQDERRFRAFVSWSAERILDTIAPEASSEQLAEFIDVATTSFVEKEGTFSALTAREIGLEPSARWAWGRAERDDFDGWLIPDHYAFETRLVKRQAGRSTLSRAGALLLELPGAEAVRWLLALESVQSLGPHDEWRVSPELAGALLASPSHHVWLHDEQPNAWPHSMASLRRLGALQVVNYSGLDLDHEYAWGYEVPARAQPLLEEIAAGHSTPFTVLASALIQDDRGRALAQMGPDYARAVHDSAAASVTLQARMVVHELRNALVPAQYALSSLTRALEDAALAEPVAGLRRRVEAGLGRALDFADNMLKVANLGDEPPAPFDASAAVREATVSMASLLNGDLHYTPPAGPRPVFGPRSRFVLVIANLLRNAAQAVAAKGTDKAGRRIEIAFDAAGNRVVIHVDDNGLGVPIEQRFAIFESGVSLRAGGSGQGLALVRQVIESDMRGAVACADGPLGGARFTIDLPLHEPGQK
jgi:signal transduction histidine kinase